MENRKTGNSKLHYNKGNRTIEVIRRPLEDDETITLRKDSLAIADIFCKHGIDGDKPFQIWAELVEAMEVK